MNQMRICNIPKKKAGGQFNVIFESPHWTQGWANPHG